jgi:hypothetical protein
MTCKVESGYQGHSLSHFQNTLQSPLCGEEEFGVCECEFRGAHVKAGSR